MRKKVYRIISILMSILSAILVIMLLLKVDSFFILVCCLICGVMGIIGEIIGDKKHKVIGIICCSIWLLVILYLLISGNYR